MAGGCVTAEGWALGEWAGTKKRNKRTDVSRCCRSAGSGQAEEDLNWVALVCGASRAVEDARDNGGV